MSFAGISWPEVDLVKFQAELILISDRQTKKISRELERENQDESNSKQIFFTSYLRYNQSNYVVTITVITNLRYNEQKYLDNLVQNNLLVRAVITTYG